MDLKIQGTVINTFSFFTIYRLFMCQQFPENENSYTTADSVYSLWKMALELGGEYDSYGNYRQFRSSTERENVGELYIRNVQNVRKNLDILLGFSLKP